MSFNAIQKDYKRVEGLEKTTGTARYVGDLHFSGALHIVLVRSPFAHAIITSIDTSRALAAPGVAVVLTGKDVPGPFGLAITDQHPLALDKVRYVGEPVVAVLAQNRYQAHEAAKLVEVAYEELPFTLTARKAAQADAPVIHEDMHELEMAPFVRRQAGNVYQDFEVRKGDVEAAFAQCAVVVEGEYNFPYMQHAMLEPHCTVACYQADDSLVMYSTTQAPFVVQTELSHLLKIPYHKVRVVAPYVGGGFGGKSDVVLEPLVACCARAVPGRYVRLQLSREEMFGGVTISRGGETVYKLGFDQDGKLLAMQGAGYYGSGGNADYAVFIVGGMAAAGTGPYEVENLLLNMYGVYTNTPPNGACRGYGHPEVHLAVESLMDKAADELGMEPHVLRLKNMLAAGKINGIGQVFDEHTGDVVNCTETIVERLHGYPKPDLGPDFALGRGLASYMKTPCMPGNCQSGARIKLNADGTATFSVGAVEMGQGTYTVLAQICAEALGIPTEKTNAQRECDTTTTPYEWQTVASHSTWGSGNALILAAEDLKRQMRASAALLFDCEPAQVELADGIARFGGQEVGWGALANGLTNPDGSGLTGPLEGTGFFVPEGITNGDPNGGQGNYAADWTVGAVGCEVAINKRTGELQIKRLLNCIDAGTIINPALAVEQVKSAMMLSVGGSTLESLVFSEDRGHIRNGSYTDYKIPGIEDVPECMEVLFVQTPEKSGPFGAKGLGEHGTVAVAPAVLRAIQDAIGIRFTTLPVTAEKIVAALKEVEA